MRSTDKKWTRKEEAALRRLYPNHSQKEVASMLGRTARSIASRAKLLRVKRNRKYKNWTANADAIMRKLYPHKSTKLLSRELQRGIGSIYQRAAKLGLEKSAKYLASPEACRLRRGDKIGAAFRFKPGQVPANKGLRRPGWAPGRMAQTQFKKGQVSINTLPFWTFRWADGYVMLKTGKRHAAPYDRWEYLHKLIWEQANGPLPNWRIARLWWKDGDHGNNALSNLELVTAADHMARTTVHNLPKPLAQIIQLRGALNRKIRSLSDGKK